MRRVIIIREHAYGGIVFNEEGKVLLRSPSGHWGGYSWTFAKGGAEIHESPEKAAIREVLEETGYDCTIIAPIPGEYESDTCTTKYFLMESKEKVNEHDIETQEIRWVSTEEAYRMIELTKTAKGRQRDRNVLESAIRLKEHLNENSGSENVI